jgi:hypothetical protein
MKTLTGLQRALYNAIKAGSPSGQMVVVHKARHPMKIGRALERKGFVTITRWDGNTYFAQITGKDPDAPPLTKTKKARGRPKLGSEKMIKTSIQVPPKMWGDLDKLSKSWKKSKSSMIVDILSSFFQKK